MNEGLLQSAVAMYLPVVTALLLRLLQGPRKRRFAACLLSVFWVATSLLILQRLNQWVGWWSFSPAGPALRGMPLTLFLGWTVLWGILPQMVTRRIALRWLLPGAVALDLFTMPMMHAVLHLGSRWMVGEAIAVLLVFMPAVCVGRWTQDHTHLPWRAAFQVLLSGGLFLYFLPEVAFAVRPLRGWEPLLNMPGWERQIVLQMICMLSLPGVSAVMEFVQRGGGTPIPYDPPQKLVTTGIYRYLANPMQLSCALVMLAWALILRDAWLLMIPSMTVVYSAGIAAWDEGQDLEQRFGSDWRQYRKVVRNWWPCWRPYHAGPSARLYIAASCGPCSEIYRWLAARKPVQLEMVAAETLPQGSIQRMRYECAGETVEGVRAFARTLEHLDFRWALTGAALRLPLIWQSVQMLLDASGLGPRNIACDSAKVFSSEI